MAEKYDAVNDWFDLYTRETKRGVTRDWATQFNDDWMSKECQTDDFDAYSLGIQVPDDQSRAVVRERAELAGNKKDSATSSTSTSTGTVPRWSAMMPAMPTPSDWPRKKHEAKADTAAPRRSGAIWVALICSVLCSM